MAATSDAELRRYRVVGIGLVVVGTITSLVGALFAHFAGLPEISDFGVELYPAIPRGWQVVLVGQIVSLTGALVGMAGIAIAFLYKRPMTWARAALGATLFSALTMVLFGIIPNEWLTLTQATLEWTPQKTILTIPPFLVLGNEVSISAAAVKDIVSGTYSFAALGGLAVVMYQWQARAQKAEAAPPPAPVSSYGRPLRKVER